MIRQILITNDDGIDADGIYRLAVIAKQFGEVTVVAPDSQRSAASHHCLFSKALTLKEYDMGIPGIKAYSLDGTPADCVRAGILGLKDIKFDIVLSGINNGYNIASDIQYSGTVGAALEAAFQGVNAIAVSQGSLENSDVIEHYLPSLLEEYMEKPLPNNQVWNINFPICSLEECKGVLRDARLYSGDFYDDNMNIEPSGAGAWTLTNNTRRKWDATEGTDLYAMINNMISVGTVTNLT